MCDDDNVQLRADEQELQQFHHLVIRPATPIFNPLGQYCPVRRCSTLYKYHTLREMHTHWQYLHQSTRQIFKCGKCQWLLEREKNVDFEDLDITSLDATLREFYAETVSAEIHFEPNKTQPVVDHHDLDESYESNNNEIQDQKSDMNNNNCDVLDGPLFLTQSTLKEIDRG
ncbi:unnamed protein product [Mytilus edulis]|uniref:Uncharacterized protein n=1 Tax=Mytilus edulis TaxID=6550 RepID=A0A8S3SWT1_MYTED|nr:unnamed protein product [Mytilus edulis]